MAGSSPAAQSAANDSQSTLNGNHDFLGPYFSSDQSLWDLNSKPDSNQALSSPLSLMPDPSTSSAMYQSALSSRQHLPAPSKRLRSQYPPDPNNNHVEFILVASFDIDRGSIMEHQYPGSISGNEHMLAELMLPDQAHNRAQDWTIFFLHKDPNNEDDDDTEERSQVKKKRRRNSKTPESDSVNNVTNVESHDQDQNVTDDRDIASSEEEDEGNAAAEGPPLIYVLNLVVTKHDSSVKRGAIVKAMAICTRHPFLHIYKPLLLLAMDEYFRSPRHETLGALYEAVNSMDLSLMPRLSLLERNILQATTSKDMFKEKFQRMVAQREADDARLGIDSPVNTASSPTGLVSPTSRYTLPRDTHDFESRILYNGVSVPVKIPTARSLESVGDFSLIKLIQTFSTPHSQSPQAFTQHPHLTTGGAYTHPVIVLVNALLTQKRIMFLGHNMPSGEVAEAVLASCALASGGMLRGFTRHAFPYTDLTKIDDLLKVPGFIAGVTNPFFANKPEWWDLLCDLPTGRMQISKALEIPQTTEGVKSFQQQNPTLLTPSNVQTLQNQDATGDATFMESILRNISNRLGEGVIRSMWRDWIIKLVRIAASFEEMVYGASALYIGGEEADAGAFGIKGHGYVWPDEATRQRETAANVNRIEGWRNTRSYYSLIQDLANLYTSQPISSIDLHHQHDRLRTQKLGKDESAAIYIALADAITSPARINQLLTVTQESHGGLFYLSLGLLHPRLDVRYKTVELLGRIMTHDAGRHFWQALGQFAKLAYFRLKREKDLKGATNGLKGNSDGGGGADGEIAIDPDGGLDKATILMEQTSVGSS